MRLGAFMALIYIADDDPTIGLFVRMTLEAAGHEVGVFDDGPPALEAIGARRPDLLLSDLRMPTMDGLDLLPHVRALAPHLPIIMITASAQLDDAIQALRSGATDYVTKPIEPDLLMQAISRVLRTADLERQVREASAEIAARDETVRQELAMAATIQRALLPEHPPVIPGLEVGMACATPGAIGGDYFSFSVDPTKRRLGVLLSDLTGHGIPAALLFCLFKQFADSLFGSRAELAPCQAMRLLNRRVAQQFPSGHFASTIYAEIDVLARTLHCVKGGQEPLLVVRQGRVVEAVMEGGPLVGAFDPEVFGDAQYPQTDLPLQPGDLVVLYTDGLIEAEDGSGKQAGSSQLTSWLREDHLLPVTDLASSLVQRAQSWNEHSPLQDDVTVIVIRVD